MKIGITGASGFLGRATAEAVLRTVDPRHVVLMTRRPDALADLVATGVQVRHADFDDADGLRTALFGVDRLLLISTDKIGARLPQQRDAIKAAVRAQVSHIVYTSVPSPTPENPAAPVADHAGTERALRDSGLRWTVLRNHVYAHQMIPAIEQAAATGRLVTNTGEGRSAYVTREDCAAVAAAVLTQGGYEDMVFDVSGPDAVDARDMAGLAQRVGGGREISIVHVDDAQYAEELRASGLPEPAVRLATSFGAAIRGGFLGNVSNAVGRLTGRPPTPLAALIRAASRP